MEVMQDQVVKRLKLKIDTLISAYESLREENLKLSHLNEQLTAELKQKDESLRAFEKRNDQQQLAKAILASSDDVHDAKLKVGRIVREIDQCIALLNR
jgi:cell division septum initiation protein DivIVA